MIELSNSDADALLTQIGLSYATASVGKGKDRIYVYIWGRRRKPSLTEWEGIPIEYKIGVGKPKAFAC